MKIALINRNKNDKYGQPPLGLLSVASVLQKDHDVEIIDANAENLDTLKTMKRVERADVIGFSATTPDINPVLNWASYFKREFPDKRIILGGCHATLEAERLIEKTYINAVVKGEGEKAVFGALENDGIFESLDMVDIESSPALPYHLIPVWSYKPHPPHGKYTPWLPMVTSRGCPFSCVFCSKPVFGKVYRSKSARRIFTDVFDAISQYNIREIAFYDDVFTLERDKIMELCCYLMDLQGMITWTCESRVDLVDHELLHRMKYAGCRQIAFGIESGSARVLETLDKKTTTDQVIKAVAMAKLAGLDTVGYFMLGNPGETTADVQKTIDFARFLKLDYAQFSSTVWFPGTKYYRPVSNDDGDEWGRFSYSTPSPDASRAYKEFYIDAGYMWRKFLKLRTWADIKLLFKGFLMFYEMKKQSHNQGKISHLFGSWGFYLFGWWVGSD